MPKPDDLLIPYYVPNSKVSRERGGYSVKLTLYCKQQGQLWFGKSKSNKLASPASNQRVSSPVQIDETIQVWGLPLAHRAAFKSFAKQDVVLVPALSFLLEDGGFTLDLVNGFLTATGHSRAMDLDPDEVSQAFSDLGKALDRLPCSLEKTTPWNIPANSLLWPMLASEFLLHLLVQRPSPELLGYSIGLMLAGVLLVVGLIFAHTGLFRIIFRSHPFQRFIAAYVGLFCILPSIYFGALLATYINAFRISEKTVLTVSNAQLTTEVRHTKSGSYDVYHLEPSPFSPLRYAGVTFTSVDLSKPDYTRLSQSGTQLRGKFSVEIGRGLLASPVCDSIARIN